MIRTFKKEDMNALINIWDKANALAHPFLPADVTQQIRRDIHEVFLPNAETWVLDENGIPLGFITMIGAEIGGLFVDPAHHRKGIGRRLVEHVVALKGPLSVEVFKENRIALPFYGLELLVGFVQALIFAGLTLVFLTLAVAHHGEQKA